MYHVLSSVAQSDGSMHQVLTVGNDMHQVLTSVTALNGRISQMPSPIVHGDDSWWWHVPSIGSGNSQVLSSVTDGGNDQ